MEGLKHEWILVFGGLIGCKQSVLLIGLLYQLLPETDGGNKD